MSSPRWLPVALIAALAFVAVLATLDSSGAVPWLGEGPGLTLDESFNVQMGVYHVRALQQYGLGILSWESISEIFGADIYNPDHPPLGRILIGLAHELSKPLLKPEIADHFVAVTCGRVASALAFAATILLVGIMTTRWFGSTAGTVASLSMLLMPRLFAHAHIASLETVVGLAYAATVFHVAEYWRAPGPTWKAATISGIFWGLALLTKIQAILLPIPIALWAIWIWRSKSLGAIVVFGLTGAIVFFLGWPWLWLDPIEHVREYLGRTTDRLTLYCWYMNHKWADVDVPWHYPLVMFAVTVPLGLQALGVIGLCCDPRSLLRFNRETQQPPNSESSDLMHVRWLLALSVGWPLAFFAIPGITVYDGTRLFLVSFPLWAVFIGAGGQLVWNSVRTRSSPRVATTFLAILLLLQSYGTIAFHPVQLSYYNLLVGGLRGASRLGFEVTYWGDGLTRSLLKNVRESGLEGSIHVAPVLHPFQLGDLRSQTSRLRNDLVPFDESQQKGVQRLVVSRRRADSWSSLDPAPAEFRLRAEVQREGVQISGYYEDESSLHSPSPSLE